MPDRLLSRQFSPGRFLPDVAQHGASAALPSPAEAAPARSSEATSSEATASEATSSEATSSEATSSEATSPVWRWATENGEPREGSEEDLIRQLASGQVPPYALVWRAGWGEWLPALQVAELAVAFPVARLPGTRTARPSSIPGSIPPVPVSEYPRLRLLAKATPLGLSKEFECPEREVITSQVPAAALRQAARVMTEPSPPTDLGLDVAIERNSWRPDDYTPFVGTDDEWSVPPAAGPALPLATEFGLQGLIEASHSQRRIWPFWLRAHGVWVALSAIVLGLGALFAARSLVGAPEPAAPEESRSALIATASGPRSARLASREVPAVGCRFEHAPTKLDDWAVVDVRPGLLTLPGDASVAIGYAQSHKHATGGVIDLRSLKFTRKFGQQNERQIFSVTPLGASGAVRYHVERMGALVASGRALDTVPPLRIGMNDDGLVLGRLDQRSEKAWELPARTLLSVPEIAAHPHGFTLATRSGRATGHLRLGALSPAGAPRSALAQVGTAEADYGRPALASGPEQTVLAVTLRSDPERGHGLLLARAKNGELPLELRALEIFGSAGVELAAPALAALPDGGFVLMWTQGVGAERRVRVQRLSGELLPLGAPFDVFEPAPALAGAVAGAIHWVNDRLLAFYFLRRDEGHSLWAASLRCGL